jgi:hypothetical protein
MEGELWNGIYRVVVAMASGPRQKRQQYSDRCIVLVYLWAVLHERPVCWACQAANWPRNPWFQLPSPATMSRRLRTESVRHVMTELERRYRGRGGPGLCHWIDAMPLPIGNASGDSQAGYGRAANGKAKGYKLYAIYEPSGAWEDWRVAPMHVSEKKMARRMIRDASFEGYLVGDGEYDSTLLYEVAGRKNIVLLAPKRTGQALGHRWQSRYRLRAIQRLEQPFAQQLLHQRSGIDRFFGSWASWGGGIKHPPPWVRGLRRVRQWVQAKLILLYARRQRQRLTA